MRCLTVVAIAVAALAGLSPVVQAVPGAGGMRVLFEADSVYHHIVVAEDDEARYLRFDRAFQSGMLLRSTYESPFLYPAYAHLALIFRPQANPSTRSARSGSTERVLVVGLGGGSIPKRFWRDYPDMAIEVAELDPMVVEVAKRFFECGRTRGCGSSSRTGGSSSCGRRGSTTSSSWTPTSRNRCPSI